MENATSRRCPQRKTSPDLGKDEDPFPADKDLGGRMIIESQEVTITTGAETRVTMRRAARPLRPWDLAATRGPETGRLRDRLSLLAGSLRLPPPLQQENRRVSLGAMDRGET